MIGDGFWKNKRVLLTGHTGFKGSWLSIWLSRLGASVFGYALDPPTNPSLFAEAGLAGLVDDSRGDLRDAAALGRAFERAKPEIVIHMAAQPIVRESYRDPVGTFEANLIGTVNVLESVRESGSVRAVLAITTDKVYENREWIWGYRENEALGGYDPYSASKACAEIAIASYRSSFFNPADYGKKHAVALASARAGNVIGGGDWAADRLVPDFVRAIGRGEKVRIRNPNAIRPWQHVLEPLSGYLALCRRLHSDGAAFASAWNFGPDDADARPVGWIVRKLCESWPGSPGFEIDSGEHAHEANFLKLDCSKAKSELGWSPRWDLGTALAKIVEWHRAQAAGGSAYELCARQIAEFEAAAGC